MAQGLQLSQRLTQSLVLAPQLQQSLALLQAPTLELKALVEQELQQNPVLEEVVRRSGMAEREDQRRREGRAETADLSEPPADITFDSATGKDRRRAGGRFPGRVRAPGPVGPGMARPFRPNQHPHAPRPRMRKSASSCSIPSWRPPPCRKSCWNRCANRSLTDEERAIAELLIGNIDDHGLPENDRGGTVADHWHRRRKRLCGCSR